MHAVVGTAGHVDHGKSALIYALTGQHPSHLPQEFERGMTIDLGFAHFVSPNGDEIGIIDVPGHERFLRNMVSGLWGLDMVLFVVAADEGWATLTEEHLRVIHALGITQILVAINKCDLVDKTKLSEVEDQILENFLLITNSLPDICHVSAKTGEGIDKLKQMIVKQVAGLKKISPLISQPHLYVDRIFSVNGIGTTVTGTLRGGEISLGDTLTLYPGAIPTKVKSLQSYYQAREHVSPHRRVALSLKQVKKQSVIRGSCLVSQKTLISMSKEWLVQLNPEFSQLKKQCELEVALGTAHTTARCSVLANGRLARIQLQTPIPAFWGQPLLLMMSGGSRMIGAGKIVWLQSLSREKRLALLNTLDNSPTDNQQQTQFNVETELRGFCEINNSYSQPPNSQIVGCWWVANNHYALWLKLMNKELKGADADIPVATLAQRFDLPQELVAAITDRQCKQNEWQLSQFGLSLFGAESMSLTATQQTLLAEIDDAGKQCFDANKQQRPQLQQHLRVLTEKKMIVPMEDKLFLTIENYQVLIKALLHDQSIGNSFSIADAKERTELARKQLIPLLNRLERDGWVKRVGDKREIRRSVSF